MTTRAEKQDMINDITQLMSKMSLMVVVARSGMTVKEAEELRKNLRHHGGCFKVVKNRLMPYSFDALEDGVKGQLLAMCTGQTGIAFSEDSVSAARVVHDFAKEHEGKIVIRGALHEGNVIDLATVTTLATLPPLEHVRAQVIGLLQASATKLARLMQEPPRRIARLAAQKGQ